MEACLSAHFVSRALRGMGFEPRIIPATYVKPFNKGQKNDYNDAEAIAEAALRPNLRCVPEKTRDQLDLQALHRVRSRLVSRWTATINQIRAFLIEQGITVRAGLRALDNSFEAILEQRQLRQLAGGSGDAHAEEQSGHCAGQQAGPDRLEHPAPRHQLRHGKRQRYGCGRNLTAPQLIRSSQERKTAWNGSIAPPESESPEGR